MNKNSKYIGLIILTIITILSCREDTIEPELVGNIRGEVLTSDGAIPIENVSVSTNPATTTTNTDLNGLFFLEDITIGVYAVRVDKEGYVTKSVSIDVKDGEQTDVVINMDSDDLYNEAPSIPIQVSPANGFVTNSVDSVTLIWRADDVDGDELKYSLRVYSEDLSLDEMVLTASTDTSYVLKDMDYSTNYFWQVTVKDDIHEAQFGAVWNFRTLDFPLNPYYFARQSAEGDMQIYSTDLTKELMITGNGTSRWRPRVNHDQDLVAFISNENIEPHIYIMNNDGTDMKHVTDVSIAGVFAQDVDFDWLPDDSGIVYPHFNRLYSVRKDGSNTNEIVSLAPDRIINDCDVAENNGRIVILESGLDGYDTKIIVLTQTGFPLDTIFQSSEGRAGGLHFSADGNRILYTHDVSGLNSAEGRMLDSRIFVYNLSLQHASNLSINKEEGMNDTDPRFSPNNGKIIFSNQSNNLMTPGRIMIMDTDGANREVIIDNAFMADWN